MKKLIPSPYLAKVKGDLKKIIDILSPDFSYVSILASDVTGRAYEVLPNEVHLSDSPDVERGFVIRLKGPRGFSEFSFNHIDVDDVVAKARALVEDDRASFLEAVDPLDYEMEPKDEPWTGSFVREVENLPQDDSAEEILSTLRKDLDQGMEKYKDLSFLTTALIITQVDKLFLSKNKELTQTYAYALAMASAVAANEKGSKQDFAGYSGLAGSEVLDRIPGLIDKAAQSAIGLLDAEPIKPGVYDIITDPTFSGLIAHEAFGHGAEMDMYVKNRAKGKEFTDKRVGSPILTMKDGAQAFDQVASFAFDDEGNPASNTMVIDQGILRSGMCDELSALQLGFHPTGNGRRESYKRKAYARMTNTYFPGQNAKLDDMIASIDHGYFLQGYTSGMEDPKNWGIQCVALKGLEIKDGKLTGKIVSPVYLTGYVPDLLNSISMISSADDVTLDGIGYCGKGWKEWVKVSMGGAYMKARGRLN
ncbi:TldD/PmbA family protein [Kallipyga massiliensis]|uniref:TldD/PmbA family protein n=1 Tax=Kallipyga massiliensis TaxID=1472764 RepID=UPI0026EA6522|nr:TldD/PmbA family protein [Kallipyga massiliensis]